MTGNPAGRPRAHHYVFAHRELLALAFDPRFFPLATGHRGREFVTGFWDHVGSNLPPEEQLPGDGLAVRVETRSGRTIVVVRLPGAERMAEAHLVAVVRGLPGEPPVRYFTLELGLAGGTHSVRTVLCEWREGTHLNYGDGPPVDEGAFLDAIDPRLGG